MAHLNEQLQQEKSCKERELNETRETHHSQISGLQEKIVNLVSIVGQSQKVVCLRITVYVKFSTPLYIKQFLVCSDTTYVLLCSHYQ